MSDEEAGTWRILTVDGTSHEVEVVKQGACYGVAWAVDALTLSSTPRMAVTRYAAHYGLDGEILAPGERPRAQLEQELSQFRGELSRAAGREVVAFAADDLVSIVRVRAVRAALAGVKLTRERRGGIDEAVADLEDLAASYES